MQCELKTCEAEHDGTYGSGRFCSKRCACAYASIPIDRSEKNRKISDSLKGRTTRTYVTTEKQKQGAKRGAERRKRDYTAQKLKRIETLSFDELNAQEKREAIFMQQNGCCRKCGLSEWMGQPITLELEHISGVRSDNSRQNLELLCPNCHSQTPTWRGRGKRGSKGTTDPIQVAGFKSIRQFLLSIGKTPSAGNYGEVKAALAA